METVAKYLVVMLGFSVSNKKVPHPKDLPIFID
jgi:hypothetical protein